MKNESELETSDRKVFCNIGQEPRKVGKEVGEKYIIAIKGNAC